MSFSHIHEKTGIGDSLLSNHLRKLKDSMLIEQFYEHMVGQDEYSFYKMTKYGKRIMDNLFDIFYVIQYTRITEINVRIKENVTAIAPKSYFSNTDLSKESIETTEEFKQIINEL